MNCYVSHPHGHIQPTRLHFLLCLLIFIDQTRFPQLFLMQRLLSINPLLFSLPDSSSISSTPPNIMLPSLSCVCTRTTLILRSILAVKFAAIWESLYSGHEESFKRRCLSSIPSLSSSENHKWKVAVNKCNKKGAG